MSGKRTWTIVCDGATARRLIGVKDKHGEWESPPEVAGLSARIITNAACFLYACEPEEFDAERLKEDPETGRLKWNKIKRGRWKAVGAERNFLSMNPASLPERDWRPGLWTEAFQAAGNALVAYLKEHPKP